MAKCKRCGKKGFFTVNIDEIDDDYIEEVI